MMKARANRGATRENAIVRITAGADYSIGPISILMTNAVMNELTLKTAEAISSSPAYEILLPLSQENVSIVELPFNRGLIW